MEPPRVNPLPRRHLHAHLPLERQEGRTHPGLSCRAEVRELGVAVQVDDGSLVSLGGQDLESPDVWAVG